VSFLASLTLIETMKMQDGSSLLMNGSVTLTVSNIVAAANSTISCEGGANIVVTGNISASGFDPLCFVLLLFLILFHCQTRSHLFYSVR
jgi:hypothetical protein